MPFPLTHLLIADELLTRNPRPSSEAALFILGSIAPDAVHYRKSLPGDMGGIGPSKKITHLCPVSDERWGAVTDNEGWINCVKTFAKSHTGPFAEGYATHVLTDICNNMTAWNSFRTNYPQEAAKGYTSDYYRDLHNIDTRLFLDRKEQAARVFGLLAKAKACDISGLVSTEELCAIQENILFEQYKAPIQTPSHEYTFVTYDETMDWIQQAADFVEENSD